MEPALIPASEMKNLIPGTTDQYWAHGGVRAHCPVGDREPVAGIFRLLAFNDGILEWAFKAPADGERNDDETAPPEGIAAVAALDPLPDTVDDARERLGWRKQRAANAVRAWRDEQNTNGRTTT